MTKNRLFSILYRKTRRDEAYMMAQRQTKWSIGYDLYSDEARIIAPGEGAWVSTGFFVDLMKNEETGDCHYAVVKGRSGLNKHSISAYEGLIDPDYYDELKIYLFNKGKKDFVIELDQRIGQIILFDYNINKVCFHGKDGNKIEAKPDIRKGGLGSTGDF